MLVYGDPMRRDDPQALVERMTRALRRLRRMPPGILRHQELVAIFIEAGELAQGLADRVFAEQGCDGAPGPHDPAMALLVALAKAVGASWRSGFAALPPLPLAAARALAGVRLPASIDIRTPEGYAFYAAYPEAWFEAAAALSGRPARVIGVRSIGTGLAAMIAAALDAPAPLTVRPFGHPFRREVAVAPEAISGFLGESRAAIAVADEGPGLSGSSFGAVLDLLEDHGVAPARLHVFPGHAGDPGPEASARHRARWRSLARHVVGLDALILKTDAPAHRLETWLGELAGSPVRASADLSAGQWRSLLRRRAEDWPPADLRRERRKILVRTGEGLWLAKFAGLGRTGERKLRLAQELHAAGFVPEPRGFRHGFLLERWIADAEPLDAALQRDRAGLVAHLGQYLGFRARMFPAGAEEGATLGALCAMARRNAAEALGQDAADQVDRLVGGSARRARHMRRVRTDNRLQAWEWLRLDSGGLVKTDAVDHHAAHDLVGCQDVAWDIAGAAHEFDLTAAEEAELAARVEAEAQAAVDRDLVRLLGPCYLAFQLGAFRLAATSLAGADPQEAARLEAAASRYAARLETALGGGDIRKSR